MSDTKVFALFLVMILLFALGTMLGSMVEDRFFEVGAVLAAISVFMLILIGMYTWGKNSK